MAEPFGVSGVSFGLGVREATVHEATVREATVHEVTVRGRGSSWIVGQD